MKTKWILGCLALCICLSQASRLESLRRALAESDASVRPNYPGPVTITARGMIERTYLELPTYTLLYDPPKLEATFLLQMYWEDSRFAIQLEDGVNEAEVYRGGSQYDSNIWVPRGLVIRELIQSTESQIERLVIFPSTGRVQFDIRVKGIFVCGDAQVRRYIRDFLRHRELDPPRLDGGFCNITIYSLRDVSSEVTFQWETVTWLNGDRLNDVINVRPRPATPLPIFEANPDGATEPLHSQLGLKFMLEDKYPDND